ncbi:methyltransferase domain-containing protein [Acidianus sp. HS-5]|uniref:methyltransferase domain-containing protein n=1 Tax=Acidianus sp. HS-5 TaxID=2886040 RepID=UPI001F2EB7A8|nr:methyltransferase domain-containing protein [Acidianus sp. HS-5]BDC18329.1 methyltransferase [Acidianus sp. HS-5]
MKSKTPKLRELVDGVSSYYIIGNIVILSPKKRDIDKEKLVKAIMQINPRVKAVYIKRKVSGELRISELELIGGEDISKTIFKENGLSFVVDIKKVYVNPSLGGEHNKVEEEVKESEKILDAFCGYGGIAMHASTVSKYVIAGDLNIEGLEMLRESLSLNRKKIHLIDIVQYDAHNLPFREKSFDKVYADNPTMVLEFLNELCRVTREELIIYILSTKGGISKIPAYKWLRVNDYSKDLFIFKGYIRCNNKNLSLTSLS